MSLNEKIIAIGGGVGLAVLAIAIFFVAFTYILIWEPVRSVLSFFREETLGTILILFYGVEAAVLFLLPPVITVLLYERKAPAGTKDLLAVSVASSALTILIIMAIVQVVSVSGWGKVFSEPAAFVCCPVAFVLWCILSGLLGPAVSLIKKRMLKR